MKPVVLRFTAMAVLFAAWIGYLFYLYLHLPTSPNGLPAVLSRPQFLVSDLDVVGVIDDKDQALSLLDLLNLEAGPKGASVAAAAGLAVEPALRQPAFTIRTVRVQHVLYPSGGSVKVDQHIGVTNFADCRIPKPAPAPPEPLPAQLSQLGPCLLPLRSRNGGLTWEVVPLPPSPGFPQSLGSPRIYPADAETLAQYRQIGKPN